MTMCNEFTNQTPNLVETLCSNHVEGKTTQRIMSRIIGTFKSLKFIKSEVDG
jgi:hypothetical protein